MRTAALFLLMLATVVSGWGDTVYHAILVGPPLPGGSYLIANGMNNRLGGVGPVYVTGYGDNVDSANEAFRYLGGATSGLGFLPDGTESYGNAVNDSGQVAGYGVNDSNFQE